MNRLAIAASLLACTAACDRRTITYSDAKTIIESNALIRAGDDHVAVDAISSLSPAESIVRATIAGQATNLKFRKYDKGWSWEFVETKGGGWIAPEVAIAAIRESHRAAAASNFAEHYRAAYSSTAAAMHILLTYAPNPYDGINAEQWAKRRLGYASIFEKSHRFPDWKERSVLLRNMRAADAWGTQFLASFDAEALTVVLRSVGPDRKPSSGDDIVGTTMFRQEVEDGALIWARGITWTLPEGLGDVVEQFTKNNAGSIAYSKAIEP